MTIYANVVKGSHGETRREVLGSGDARQTNAKLRSALQRSLTFLPAPMRPAPASTLVLRVSEVEWHKDGHAHRFVAG